MWLGGIDGEIVSMHDVLPVLLYCCGAIAAITTFALIAQPRRGRRQR